MWVKHSCKSIITIKRHYEFTLFSFSGQTHFRWECLWQISDSIKIAIFKILRKLDTTSNFARSITRVSTHEHEHWQYCLCTQTKKRVFKQVRWHMLVPLAAVMAAEKYQSQQLSTRYLMWLFRLLISVLYEAPFSTSRSVLFFTNEKNNKLSVHLYGIKL